MDDTWLQIGRIVGPHGVRGEVRVHPDSDFPERFEVPGQRWLQPPTAQTPEAVELVRGRLQPGKNLYVIQLAHVHDRAQAEALKGSLLLVPQGDRLPLEPDEFHVQDLIGLTVRHHASGVVLGTVSNLFSAGNDLLEVTRSPQSPVSDAALTDSPTVADSSPEPAEPLPVHPSHRKSKRRKKPKVTGDRPQTVLIPFVEEIVPVVDVAQGYLEVDPPAGLVDWLPD